MRRKKIDWSFAPPMIAVSEPISNDSTNALLEDVDKATRSIEPVGAKPAKKKGCKICKSMSHIKRVF